MKKLKKLLKNPFVQKWFLTLLGFVAALFISFMFYTYANSQRLLKAEFTAYSELQTERIAAYLDDSFYNYNQIAALLSLNEQVRIYLFKDNATEIFPDLYTQIYNQLLSYRHGFTAIDSIYLYPDSAKEVFTQSSNKPISKTSMDDEVWLTYADIITRRTILPRKKNSYYPYLISVFYPLYISGQHGLITVNIDVSKISILQDGKKDTFQSIYIISDKGEILYRNYQQDMPESLDTVEQLHHFDSNSEFCSMYVDESSPYIYVQQHSEEYPWHYVTITYTQNYVGRTYNIYSSLLTFLPWLFILALIVMIWLAKLATHPIRTISDFLEDPLSGVPDNISEPETEKMIRQFINYIQTNQALSEKLKHQMERQNKATFLALQSQINPHFLFNTLNLIRNMEIETLGYEHEAPNLTLSLSKLLRYAVSSTELVTLQTEFYHTNLYLNILNQRYKKKMMFQILQDDLCLDVLVPKLILQPLIENAVFHGCSPQLENGNRILIDARVEDHHCIIMVKDSGVGIASEDLDELRKKVNDVENIPGDSIGLQNVALRMHLTYGDAFEIIIDSVQGQGTCITLFFPVSPTKLE